MTTTPPDAHDEDDLLRFVPLADMVHDTELLLLETLMREASDLSAVVERMGLDNEHLDAFIGRRDAAEEAVSDAVTGILGRPPEWSNLYGYAEALEECRDAVTLRASTARASS